MMLSSSWSNQLLGETSVEHAPGKTPAGAELLALDFYSGHLCLSRQLGREKPWPPGVWAGWFSRLWRCSVVD